MVNRVQSSRSTKEQAILMTRDTTAVCLLITVIAASLQGTLMESKLRISAWNARGMTASGPYLNKLMQSSDVVAVSEHNLYTCDLHRLGEINTDFESLGRSSADLDEANRGRIPGHCGVAILWRKTISRYVRPLVICEHDRLCGIELCEQNKPSLFIISVYMPQQSCTISSYQETLDILEGFVERCPGEILLIGDWNAHFGDGVGHRTWGTTNQNGHKVLRFVERQDLKILDITDKCQGPTYTYQSHSLAGVSSYLDHAIMSKTVCNAVKKCAVLEDELINTSDHLPLTLTIDTDKGLIPAPENVASARVLWHKLQTSDVKTLYTDVLDEMARHYMMHRGLSDVIRPQCWSRDDIACTLEDIVNMIRQASQHLPSSAARRRRNLKHYWNPELSLLAERKKTAVQRWIEQGKPRDATNAYWIAYKEAKKAFRKEQRTAVHNCELNLLQELEKCGAVDQRAFWSLVNKRRHKRTTRVRPLETEAGILTDPTEIREGWRTYFEDLYTPKDLPQYDGSFKEEIEDRLRSFDQEQSSESTLFHLPITVNEIQKQCKKLRTGKAAGFLGIQPEHLKYMGPTFTVLMSHFLSAMLHMEWRPPALKRGIVIPIPKGTKDSSVPSNNRGITLMPTIGKLYDAILLRRADEWFQNSMDMLQGANRPGCSCLETALVLHEAITYNNNRDSTVYVGLMDVTKAFDTVWLDGLFVKLRDRGMDSKLWRVIRDAYDDFRCCVAVAGGTSDWFVPLQGVHQGDVLSMRLHSLFIDELILELRAQTRGIKIGAIDCSCPSFADDMTVATLSKAALNHQFRVAYDYSNRWRFQFSAEKTCWLTFGRDMDPTTVVTLGGKPVATAKSYVHVGVPLSTTKQESHRLVDNRIAACRRSYFGICGVSGSETPLPPLTASRLYQSICVPQMTYGAEIWTPEPEDLQRMEKFHKNTGRLIQGLSPTVATPACYGLLGWRPIEAVFDIAKLMYLWRILMMPCWSLYSMVAISRLTDCRFSWKETIRAGGPISHMYQVARKYGLCDAVHSMMDSGTMPSRPAWHRQVVRLVTERHHQTWLMQAVMYRTMDTVVQVVCATENRGTCVWWSVCRVNPSITRLCRLVVRLMCGDHSLNSGRGRFTNNTVRCCLCDSYEQETVEHTLFTCEALHQQRTETWQAVLSTVPHGMRRAILEMTTAEKTYFVLSGCQSNFVREWQYTYETIARFVNQVYTRRQALMAP